MLSVWWKIPENKDDENVISICMCKNLKSPNIVKD